jgi:hypothetical protein
MVLSKVEVTILQRRNKFMLPSIAMDEDCFFYPWLWAGPLDGSYCLCGLFSYTMECLQRD